MNEDINFQFTFFYFETILHESFNTHHHSFTAETFRIAYPRAYRIHKLINQPDNVKRFIIGRQFCTVLTGFLLAQIFTFANFPNPGYDPIAFFIIVKSGLVGVLIVLAFGQLMPELLAAQFPLRFMDMPGTANRNRIPNLDTSFFEYLSHLKLSCLLCYDLFYLCM